MNSFRICCLILVTLLVTCAPLAAQPSADASGVTITYTGSAGTSTASVHISNATDVTARISPNLGADGNTVNSSDPRIAVFTFNVVGTTINVGANPGPVGTLAQKGAASYTGAVLLVSATGCVDCITIPLTMSITGGGQLTAQYNGTAIPTGGVQIFASSGGSTSFQLTIASTVPTGFTVSTNVTWLTANPGPASGSLQPGVALAITFFANGSGLTGANNALITFTSNGAVAVTVPVVFNVGSGGGLTLSPNPLNFQYVTSTNSFTTGQTQNVSLSGPVTSATYTAQSNQSWLQVFGGQSAAGQSVLTQMPVSVNVAIVLPFTGTIPGTITVHTSDGFTATLNVNLTISSTSSGGGSSLNFSVATPGGAAPPSQQFQITGSGSFGASAIETTGTSVTWLSVSPNNGTLSSFATVLTVSINPGNLGAGSYVGSIFITTTGLLQNGSNSLAVSVTLNIGGSGASGAVVSPTSLLFTLPSGGSQVQSLIVNGDGTSFSIQSFAPGFTVSPSSGATTPTVVSVTATSSSPTSGSLQVTSSLGTQSINLTVNMLGGNVLTSTPASLAFINTSGGNINTNLSINSSGDNSGGNLTFTVSSVPKFVTYSANATTTPTAIGLSINGGALGPGFNTGNLVLTSNTAANQTLIIPITVLAPGSTPGFAASPNPVSMSAQAFGPPVTTMVQLTGLSGTNFNASTISSGNWLSVSPTSGASPATLTLTANPQALGVNTYNGTVTVTGNNGSSLTFTVVLTTSTTAPVTPVLSIGTTSVTFNYNKGDPAPAAQSVQISGGGVAVNFTVAANVNWIALSQTTGSTPSTLNISLNTALLSTGTQTGTVTITAAGVTGSPVNITVIANVAAPAALALNASSASFSFRTGDANPAPQTIQITSTGIPISFTISVSNAPWLTVTPTSGTTPATLTLTINPANLAVGQYSANVAINSSGGSPTIGVVLTVSAPLPTISEVHNGASNLPGPIAPGLIIVLTGSGMGPDTLVPYIVNGSLFATLVSSVRVLVGGFEAPIIYVSATQVAAIVPYALSGRASTFVQVEYLGQKSNSVNVQVVNTAPGVFTLNASGSGPGAILNSDNSVNSDANPAGVDTIIQVFATGEGQTIPAGIDGRLADRPNNLPKPVVPVTAAIDDVPADVTYYGAAPGLVAGVLQVNVRVPPGTTNGELILTIGGNKSQRGVTVAIR